MGTLINSINYTNVLDEAYAGETQFIKDFIELISKARAPYVGKMKKPIKGNKDFIKIGEMLADEFGFYSVDFSVPFDLSMNAFTYPITMSIDKSIVDVKPKFIKDKGFKYDQISKMCIIVAVTAGVWFNEKFTDREIVAAILHEIGHSFVLQSERMVDIIEANRLSIAYSVINQIIIHLATLQFYNIPSDIKLLMNTSNRGREIINKVNKELANNPLFAPLNGISTVFNYLSTSVMQVFREILSLTMANKILSLPFAVINKIFSVFSKPAIAASRSQEYLSDSFATTYGLGPEITSFLMKIEFDPGAYGIYTEKLISKIPILGALHKSLDIPVLLLSNSISTHPSTPARINKILEELNKELKDSDLSPKTKQAVKENIKQLEKIKNECATPPDKKKYDAEMVQRLWISFITNKGEIPDDLETYYTDLNVRDKYVKVKESVEFGYDPFDNIELK